MPATPPNLAQSREAAAQLTALLSEHDPGAADFSRRITQRCVRCSAMERGVSSMRSFKVTPLKTRRRSWSRHSRVFLREHFA